MKRILPLFLAFLVYFLAPAQIFYKIINPHNDKVSYLFGTHHLAPLSMLDSIPGIQSALDDTEVVVGEVDMSGGMLQMAFAMQKYVKAPQDSTISNLLSPEEFRHASEQFKLITNSEMGLESLSIMKPMVAETFVTLSTMKRLLPDYKEDDQPDSYFQVQARALGKEIIGLESVDQQASYLFNTLPISAQLNSLLETLDNPEESLEQMKIVNDAYMRHDLNALHDLTLQQEGNDDSEKFMNVILNERNHNWLEKLPSIIENRPSFIAVGALHLPGPNGLIEGLRGKGFVVTPID